MKVRPTIWILLILAFGSLIAISLYAYDKHFKGLPYIGNNVFSYDKKIVNPLGNLAFTTQDGVKMELKHVQAKAIVMNYFFTRCGSICPKMSKNLTQVQDVFGKNEDVKIISISCDSEFDQVPQLKTYANQYQADSKFWSMGNGQEKEVFLFARNELRLVAINGNEENDFIHSPHCVLIDEEKRIRGYYDATDKSSIDKLIADIKKLL